MSGMSDEGRAFSGTATYETEFNVKSMPEGLFELGLGVVRDFSRVFLNGHEVTDLWAMPYRCDVSKYVKCESGCLVKHRCVCVCVCVFGGGI
jgi:hypothetical protein